VLNFDHQIAGQSHDTVMANKHSENEQSQNIKERMKHIRITFVKKLINR
jgi:hypothetical protein